MPTPQEMPRGGFDGVVCIGVPVAQGYPVPTPPSPTTTSGGATHNYLDSDESSSAMSNSHRSLLNLLKLISTAIVFYLFILAIEHLLYKYYPSFKIESISVALDESDIFNIQSQAIRAAWDIGFSIKNPGRDFSVSVRCMSPNWSANIIQDARNTTALNAIVITPLPREFVLHELMMMTRGLTLQYDVMFRSNKVEGMCKNMTIAISFNATHGIMVGGPRMCHID